jgi:hypothetical protein
MANYDKIPFKNRDIDFFGGKKKKIRNMRQEGQYVELKPGEQSTHLMYHQGKEVFPSVFPKDKNTKYIFESPDGGKTVYRREFRQPHNTRELISKTQE